MSFIRSFTEI